MQMEMCMKDNGIMINQTVTVNINTRMESYIKDNGKMISKMEKVYKCGQMVKNIRVNLIWDLNLEKEC